MRIAQYVLMLCAIALIIVAIVPGGTLLQFMTGLALLLGSIGCAVAADNDDIKYRRTRTQGHPRHPRHRQAKRHHRG